MRLLYLFFDLFSFQIMIILIWVGVLLAAVLLYYKRLYSKFDKFGIKHKRPVIFFGNSTKVIFRKENIADSILNLYNEFPGEKFVGRFDFSKETVMICDLGLIKNITIKDFEHFVDHSSVFEDVDSPLTRTLLNLKGQEWKDMRSSLSPAFTSSKIRLMVPLMVEVGEQLIASLKNSIESSKNGYIDIDCQDLTSRYTNDVIASCAFGLKVDSLKDKDNMFFTMGKETTTLDYRQIIRFIFILKAPKLAKYFNIDMLSADASKFFRSLVVDTMKDRELRHVFRPDMIHLLMELQKGKLKHETKSDDKTTGFATVAESSVGTKAVDRVWSDNDLIAQAIIFFVAGFDTVSRAAMFLLYEVAINPEIQEKLVTEILENAQENGGKFDLNSIQKMQYMDMVVSEVLRKWPPGIALDRVCVKDYNLGRPNENASKDFIVRKGTSIVIPVYAFQRDPQYFPDPEKFDPERFSDDNKHSINPLTYMPFGTGPRNCIGSRFALCELKVMVYQILQHFELSPCEKTCIPAVLATDAINLQLKGGNWTRFRVRS